MPKIARGFVAEFLGTFALVFFGCGSIVLAQRGDGDLLTVALAHGLALAVFVQGCLHLSGSQFNPAVSIAVAVLGKQNWGQAAAFIGAQLFAAACAVGVLVLFLGRPATDPTHLGATLGAFSGGDTANIGALLALEFLQTFALMTAILTCIVSGQAKPFAGLAVGGTVAMCILAFGPWTGSSMNPARTFGPMLYHWQAHAESWWVYIAAPIAGAIAAALLYRAVLSEESAKPAE